MTARSPLARALRANALLSLVTGLAGLLMSAPLAETVGVMEGTSYQVLGGVVLVHMVALLLVSGRATIVSWTRLNVLATLLFVVLLLGLLIFAPISTIIGRGIIGATACLYAALALWQMRALRVSAPQPAQ